LSQASDVETATFGVDDHLIDTVEGSYRFKACGVQNRAGRVTRVDCIQPVPVDVETQTALSVAVRTGSGGI
jgi:hypothetical protein